MSVNYTDFDKIWASTSPLTPYEFSESQYKEGWNFVGNTPPSRQMWDFLQKNNDEKMQYLADNYLPLSGGTLTGDVLGVTPPNGDNSKKIANTEFIQALASILVPVGCVQAYAGNTLPNGWLLCDGSAVSRTDYADLYAVIGDTYGAGDGVDTFNLPDLVDKFVEGSATSGTVKTAGLPNIEGTFTPSVPYNASGDTGSISTTSKTGAFSNSGSTAKLRYFTHTGITTADINIGVKFSASDSNAIYGSSDTVQPPALTMQYIIKY